MIQFDPKEIDRWADQNTAEAFSRFPTLVRRLMLATLPTASLLDVPDGSAVWTGGWDGLLEVEKGNSWVPSGFSAWEFNSGGSPAKAATENYKKRTNAPIDVDRETSSFVFVTPRVWSQNRKWEAKRQSEGRWGQVRALDATDLASWLLEAAGVADWFARMIDVLPAKGVACLEEWWENWAGATQPKLSSQLVLAGRMDGADSIADWVTKPASAFYVRGGVRDEAIAAVMATAVLKEDSQESQLLRSRAVVVNTADAWNSLVNHAFPLILVRNFVGDVSSQVAVSSGHHVLVPLDSTQDTQGNGCDLGRLGREETASALSEMGLSENKARSLFRKTARRLQVIRRFLLDEAGALPPTWAKPDPVRSLIVLAMLGQWDGEREGDREVVSRLAKRPYSDVEGDLATLSNMADSPVAKVGARWRFVSHEEAWHVLAPYLTSSDTERFEELAVGILGTPSPGFDLPVERRPTAVLTGDTLPHSYTLLDGLARALALMGVSSDRMKNVSEGEYLPMRVLSGALGEESDWRVWATLAPQLPALAEAAPSDFLSIVENCNDSSPNPLEQLFLQNGLPLFNSQSYVDLLWALERLAWSEEHFSRVATILARLTGFERGGQLANGPSASLADLFHWRLRFTEASDEYRLDTLQAIVKRHPEAGWDIVVTNLSDSYMPIRDLNDTHWRPWGQAGCLEATPQEQATFTTTLFTIMEENVGANVARWADVLNFLPGLTTDYRKRAVGLLDQIASTLRDDRNVGTLRTAIRSSLDSHRSFPDAAWAMNPCELDALEAAYTKLAPSDPVAGYSWLFDSEWPDLPEGKRDEYEEAEKQILDARRDAIRQIYDYGGVEALARLIAKSNAPHSVGTTAAVTLTEAAVFELALGFMGPNRTAENKFAMCFFMESGLEVCERALSAARLDENSPPEALADILIATSVLDFDEGLERLESEDSEVREVYWQRIQYQAIARANLDEENYCSTVARLLQAQRSLSVMELIWRRRVSPDLIVQTLRQLPGDMVEQTDPGMRLDVPTLARVFDQLDANPDVTDQEIAGLEFPFARALKWERSDLALYRAVLKNPFLFADLISLVYRRSDGREEPALPGWTQKEQFVTFFDILNNLQGFPGLSEDGTVDSDDLTNWVSEVRRLCAGRDLKDPGDQQIGQVLSRGPEGTDEIWPCEPVRELLETLPSTARVADGFVFGRIAQRGVTARRIFDGGIQEQALSAMYRRDAKTIAAKWPVTAALLRRIGGSFEARAGQEDTQARWRDEAGD